MKMTNKVPLYFEEGFFSLMNDEDAKSYYGEECYSLIKTIYKFCKESNQIIYQHATNLESANDIVQRGFIVRGGEIGYIPNDVLKNTPIAFEYDEDGLKSTIYSGPQCELNMRGLRDELDNTQHFFENAYCNLNWSTLSNPNVNRSNFGATCLFVVSKYFKGSREYVQYGVTDSHYDNWEDKQMPETFFERHVIPTQFCIGYLDVINKRFVVNPNFQLNYGITDEFVLGTTFPKQIDLSNKLNQSSRKN